VVRRAGLGLLAGAVLLAVPAAARAQTPPRDTTRRDSVRVAVPIPPRDSGRIDSTLADRAARPAKARADSIQPPMARAELAPVIGIGPAHEWDREALLASGALTLTDLLERVPGMTTFRSGYLASAQTAAYLGDFRALRVFQDGVELDVADARTGGVRDVGEVQLWTLERLVIEQTAGEVRLHLRTWTVQRTTPYTRTDVATGDENTNLYRGLFGRRFGNGATFQLAAQQFATGSRNRRFGGGGGAFSAMGRAGWANARWSADVFFNRNSRTRDRTTSIDSLVIPSNETARTDAYVRAAYGSPDSGVWAQLLAGTLSFGPDYADTTSAFPLAPVDTPTVSRTQYVAAAGLTRWGVRFSATNRLRVFDGRALNSPALRAAYDRPFVAASAYGERSALDSITRLDATARVSPLPWLAVLGGVSRSMATRDSGDLARTDARLELGARLGRLWISGGRLMRDGAELAPPRIYERFTDVVTEPRASGTVFAVRGPLFKAVSVDLSGTIWDAGGLYRPQYQARSELLLATNWLGRFPSGTFGIVARLTNDYRGRTLFAADTSGATFTPPSNTLSALLEIRIQQAVLSWQLRNVLAREYYLVPGFQMPGPLNFYGVRWEFWN
jgi:hypothetical protein